MPAFRISFRPAISSPHHPMLSDELITPAGWTTQRVREYWRSHHPHNVIYSVTEEPQDVSVPA